MNIEVNDSKKNISIWLSQKERDSHELQEELSRLYQQCDLRGYLPVVFYSGTHNLEEETFELLRYNRKRLAELEVTGARALS